MEIWKDTQYDGYQVSSLGNVRSIDRYQKNSDGKTYRYSGRVLSKTNMKGRDGYGYYVVNIRQHGKSNVVLVHRLVATAFIDNPDNLPTVNHLDGDKHNNDYHNLEWASYSDNNIHALNNSLRYPRGDAVAQKTIDGDVINIFRSAVDAEKETGISKGSISHCINGRTKTAGGYIWEKLEGQSTIESTNINSEASRVHST